MPLLIKTYIKDTENKGFGLFTEVNIKKDDIVYIDDLSVDRLIHIDLVKDKPLLKEFFDKYYTFYKDTNSYYLTCDNARFLNHSFSANLKFIQINPGIGKYIAARDIMKNEELLCNYTEFDDASKEGDFGFEIKN